VDLLLIHWPNHKVPMAETFGAFKELHEAGKVRNVGVSNFSINHVRKALEVSPLPIVTNQVEFHPLLNQRELLEYCHSRGVIITAYSPLGRGELLRDARITKIADKYGKTPAQVLLRWALQKGMIVIPKASSEPHLRDNLGALGWELDEEDMAAIEAMNENKRIIDPDFAEWNLPYEQIA
jgi:diketogulonate reductase-like aldo/keto reductase